MGRTREPWPADRSLFAAAAAFLLAIFGAGTLGIAITDDSSTAVWWPAGGISALMLMVLPRRWWPWLAVGVAVACAGANLAGGQPVSTAAWLALADTAETVLVVVAVHRRMGRRMRTVADFGFLLGVSLGAAFVAGLGVAGVAQFLLDGTFADTLVATTAAHWASLMLVLPLGLIPRHRTRGDAVTIGVQATLLIAATLLAFSSTDPHSLGFLPLPFLIWAGVSFGYRVVAVEQLVIAVLVTGSTLADRGPFAQETDSANQFAQLYLVSLVIAGLPLALAVAEQRIAASAARAEKRRTEAVIDSSTTPILVTDAEGGLLSVNPATTALSGFAGTDLVGRPFWEQLLDPADWEVARLRLLDPDRYPGNGEAVIRTAAGGERIVAYSNGVLIDPDDGLNYVITLNDITAERATSHFLQHLFRSATTIAILGTDRTGAVTMVNAGAEEMLRVGRAEITGRNFLDFFDPAEVDQRRSELGLVGHGVAEGFATLVAEVDADGDPRTRDWSWVPPDGVPLRVSMTASLVADTRQRPIGYLFVARDVTETRRSQELLHQALEREQAAVGHLRALDHAKDDFVSTVSHELRTPLTSIIGSIELLGDGMAGDLEPDQQHLVQVVERNAERLLALANDLLLLASFENASPQTDFVVVDLRDVVRASINSVGALLTSRSLDLGAELPDAPVRVLGDAGYLERAVTNLLTNAVKFTQDGGRITAAVRPGRLPGTVTVSVDDTGIGIPVHEVAEVFQRFFRSSNVHADAIQGTGLGLSIVHSIVETHRGSIDVTSEPGAGSTFTITLPLAP